MKIEDVAYAIAGEALVVLEQKYHYRIPDEHKRDIQRTVQSRLTEILVRASKPAEAEGEAEPKKEEEAEQPEA